SEETCAGENPQPSDSRARASAGTGNLVDAQAAPKLRVAPCNCHLKFPAGCSWVRILPGAPIKTRAYSDVGLFLRPPGFRPGVVRRGGLLASRSKVSPMCPVRL